MLLRRSSITTMAGSMSHEEVCNVSSLSMSLTQALITSWPSAANMPAIRPGAIEHGQTAIYLDAGLPCPTFTLGIMAKRSGDAAARAA